MKKLSDYIKKPWLKAIQKEIKILINNQTFLVEDPKKGEPVTPCMDVNKAKTRSDGSLDKLRLRISVRGRVPAQDRPFAIILWYVSKLFIDRRNRTNYQ